MITRRSKPHGYWLRAALVNDIIMRIGALGSGSDYTVFLDHLGVASLNLGFGGESGGGIYHSIYNSFAWYKRFSDTTFEYRRALAQTAGAAMMRLTGARIVPFEFTNFAETVGGYVDEIAKLPKQDVDVSPLRGFSLMFGFILALKMHLRLVLLSKPARD